MMKTRTPTWLARAPKNFGSKTHGKLKADQWRTVCLVNLPITLIRLWGWAGCPERDQNILKNFLALVTAVRWATFRTTSAHHIDVVEKQMRLYLDTLVELFPDYSLRPNNHLSLHLAECLRSFGPVHGWWAFPFERYNGILQRFNTNNKLGAAIIVSSRQIPESFHVFQVNWS
jgi:hypothetical protein